MEKPEDLEKRIADLRARWPRHSAPAAMLVELEELEEALACAQEAARAGGVRPVGEHCEDSGG